MLRGPMNRIRSPSPPIRASCSSQRSQMLVGGLADPDEPGSRRLADCLGVEQDPARHVDEEIGPFSQIDRSAAEYDPGVFRQPELAPDLEPERVAVETLWCVGPGRCRPFGCDRHRSGTVSEARRGRLPTAP